MNKEDEPSTAEAPVRKAAGTALAPMRALFAGHRRDSGPAQRRQVDAAQPHRRREAGHRHPQAADDPQPDRRRLTTARRPDRLRRHAGRPRRARRLNRFMVERGAGRDRRGRRGAAGRRAPQSGQPRATARDARSCAMLAEARRPVVLAINKVDTLKDKPARCCPCSSAWEQRRTSWRRWSRSRPGRAPTSTAWCGELCELLPAGPPLYGAGHAHRSHRAIPGRRADPRAAVPQPCARSCPTRSRS